MTINLVAVVTEGVVFRELYLVFAVPSVFVMDWIVRRGLGQC